MRAGAPGLPLVIKRKAFFFEKRTKKLLFLGLHGCDDFQAKWIKVFCFFFSKKKALLPV